MLDIQVIVFIVLTLPKIRFSWLSITKAVWVLMLVWAYCGNSLLWVLEGFFFYFTQVHSLVKIAYIHFCSVWEGFLLLSWTKPFNYVLISFFRFISVRLHTYTIASGNRRKIVCLNHWLVKSLSFMIKLLWLCSSSRCFLGVESQASIGLWFDHLQNRVSSPVNYIPAWAITIIR